VSTSFDALSALTAAANAAKGADPQSVVASVKAANSPHEAITNVQAIAGYGNAVRTFDSMSALQPSVQAAAWQALTDPEQDSLSALGYKPPKIDALTHVGAGGQHGGFWSAIASGWHDVTSAVGHGVSDTLNVLGAPIRAVQHLYRAGHVLGEEGLASKYGWTYVTRKAQSAGVTLNTSAFADVFSPSAWAQAWRATTTGNSTLDPALARGLNAKYGQSQVRFALRVLNSGTTAVVNATPQKTRPALVRQLQDPRFKQLLDEVGNARMSLGRNVVGSTFMNQHPEAGKYLSGGIDAAYDIYATPLNKLGEAAKAARAAKWGLTPAEVGRYLVPDSTAAESYLSRSATRRFIDHVGKYLENGDYAGLGRFDPRLENVSAQLANEGIDSAEKFRTWLVTRAGLRAILTGNAARISQRVAILPHLTPFGWLKSTVKGALQDSIDRLADGKARTLDKITLASNDLAGAGDLSHQDWVAAKAKTLEELLRSGEAGKQAGHIPGVSDLARLVRRLSTFIPTKPYLDIGTDADVPNLRRFLQGFLPARGVNDAVNVFLGSDLGTRYRIVQAAREQMLHALGAYRTPEAARATEDAMAGIAELEREQAYSVGGFDQMLGDDGKPFPAAILRPQLSNRIAIPLPNEVRKFVREQSVLGRLGINPLIWATRFMYLWRTMILDRTGFAVRISLTENLIRLLKTGPKRFIGSYLANGAAQTRSDEEIAAVVDRMVQAGAIPAAERDSEMAAQRALATKPLTPYHPIERALALLGERIPEGIREHVDDPAKFYGAVIGATARKALRGAERKTLEAGSMGNYIEAATHLYTHQPVQDSFQDLISMAQGSQGLIWTPVGVKHMVKDGLDVATAGFSEATKHDPLWRMKWQFSLDQLAQDPMARAVLDTIDKSPRTQERAVLRVLNDPEFADTKAQFARASRLPDGRVVGIDATQAEADRAWSRVVRKHVNALVRSGDPENGAVLHDLVQEMLDTGRGPHEDSLNAVRQHDLPASVFGPDILPVGKPTSLLNKSFELLVGKPANWLVRQPLFIENYAEALPAAREYAHALMPANVEGAEKLASDVATERAVNATIPFIHNPRLRTQFEDQHRILLPFLFAQRQFIQRWARLVQDSPDAVRKLQLTMHGLRSMGFIRKDPTTGQTFFYYPGSQYPQELIQHVLTKLGVKASVPMIVPFTGQVQYLMAGLNNPVTPSFGPFAAVGLKELGKLMPELHPATSKLLGRGATTPIWQQFAPTIFSRLWDALGPSERQSQLASTTMQAIKYLDYAGYTLPNNATPQETEQYVSRVQNWARSLLVMRAALGFVLPATPSATLDPKHLNVRFHQLLNELTYTKAVAEFVREHPTATAYTVGETQNATDGYTPATHASLTWLEDHLAFAKAHPLAAAWFIPRSTGTYTASAYREQIALGMRDLRPVSTTSPSDPGFMQEVIMARAANAYYETITRYEKAYTSTTSSTEHQQLVHWLDSWKAAFFKQNPIFGDYITSEASHIRRLNTLADMEKALTTPNAPKTPQTEQLRTVLEAYNQFVSGYTATVGMYSTAATHQRKALKQETLTWLGIYAQRHHDVADFINTVVRIEVETQK